MTRGETGGRLYDQQKPIEHVAPETVAERKPMDSREKRYWAALAEAYRARGGNRAGKRRKVLTSRIDKLREMRPDRGAAPSEAEFADRKAQQLAHELANLAPEGPRFLPQYMHRKPAVQRGGRKAKAKVNLKKAVTERALIQRINRALPDCQKLKIGRGKRQYLLLQNGEVVVDNVDIEALAHELKVLKPWEIPK
jgi:hypothetical protein